LVVTGFGSAENLTENKIYTFNGVPEYLDPEILKGSAG
jgi:hypothetical protein